MFNSISFEDQFDAGRYADCLQYMNVCLMDKVNIIQNLLFHKLFMGMVRFGRLVEM